MCAGGDGTAGRTEHECKGGGDRFVGSGDARTEWKLKAELLMALVLSTTLRRGLAGTRRRSYVVGGRLPPDDAVGRSTSSTGEDAR